MSDLDDFIVHDDSLDMEVDNGDNFDSMSSLSLDSPADSDSDDEARLYGNLRRLRRLRRRDQIIEDRSGSDIDSTNTESPPTSDQESDEIETEPLPISSTEENQQPMQSTINQQPTGSADTQQHTGSADTQQPTGSADTQQYTRSADTHQPTGSADTHQPTRSADTHQPTGSADTHQPTGSADTHQPTGFAIIQQSTGSQENPTTVNANNVSMKSENPFSCPICLESLTNTGVHRPACLKCGHIFGEQCLERWIRIGCNRDARRCPTCNTKACLKDIRILYAKSLCVVDTVELTALERKLEKNVCEKNVLKAEIESIKVKNELLSDEVNKLKVIIDEGKSGCSSTTTISPRKCIKTITISKHSSCRVMAFNKNKMLLAVSQSTGSSIFSNLSHVIRKVNTSILELSKECIYAHSKPIRDMAFHPVDDNLLASVSLDKCINVTDMVSNTIAASVMVDEPLWSCCWSGENPNILVAGGQGGGMFYMDRRYMKVLDIVFIRSPACVSLVPLPPSNSHVFTNGGFIKTRMDHSSVFEYDSNRQDAFNYNVTELPLKGLWTNTSFDNQSNLILSTSKPCGFNKSIRHIVSRISDSKSVASCKPVIQPVATFYGGDKATQISRSCIVPSIVTDRDTLVSSYDEKTSAIKLFSVDKLNIVHNFHVQENILDLCPLNGIVMNGSRSLAALSGTSLSIFSV